jgi:hypothetical protein
LGKLNHSLVEDIAPLLPPGVGFTEEDAVAAFRLIWGELITRLNGDAWKSSKEIIAKIREIKIPRLLEGIE